MTLDASFSFECEPEDMTDECDMSYVVGWEEHLKTEKPHSKNGFGPLFWMVHAAAMSGPKGQLRRAESGSRENTCGQKCWAYWVHAALNFVV